jgi:hypothetical protein
MSGYLALMCFIGAVRQRTPNEIALTLVHGGLRSAELSSDSSPEPRRNRGRHRRRGPLHRARREIRRMSPKQAHTVALRCPHDCGKPRTRANFAGFSRGARRSLPAWRREGDLNPRAPSACGLLKTPRVRPTILRSFSETSHREFIRHRFDTFKAIRVRSIALT